MNEQPPAILKYNQAANSYLCAVRRTPCHAFGARSLRRSFLFRLPSACPARHRNYHRCRHGPERISRTQRHCCFAEYWHQHEHKRHDRQRRAVCRRAFAHRLIYDYGRSARIQEERSREHSFTRAGPGSNRFRPRGRPTHRNHRSHCRGSSSAIRDDVPWSGDCDEARFRVAVERTQLHSADRAHSRRIHPSEKQFAVSGFSNWNQRQSHSEQQLSPGWDQQQHD